MKESVRFIEYESLSRFYLKNIQDLSVSSRLLFIEIAKAWNRASIVLSASE